MQALIIEHLISKRWGVFYLDHSDYDLPQYKGDGYNPITFWKYLSNMTAKTGKYSGDQLFHAISRYNDPTTVYFIYFPHCKLEATQFLNGLTCILSEELTVNPNGFIAILGVERATMGVWDIYKRTFTNQNELHN